MPLPHLHGRPGLAEEALAEALVEVLVVGDVLGILRQTQLLHGCADCLSEARVLLLVEEGQGAVHLAARRDPPVQAQDVGSLHLLLLVAGRLHVPVPDLLAQCDEHELESGDDPFHVLGEEGGRGQIGVRVVVGRGPRGHRAEELVVLAVGLRSGRRGDRSKSKRGGGGGGGGGARHGRAWAVW